MRKKTTKKKKRRRRRRSRLLLLLLPPLRELGFFESLFLPPRLDSPAISLRSLKSAGPVEAERAPPPPRPPFKVPPSTESCAAAPTPPPPPPRGIWLVATSGLAAAAVAEEAWEASWKVGGDPRRGIFLVFHSFSQNFPSFFSMNCGPRRLPKNLGFQKSNQLSFSSSPLSLLLSSLSLALLSLPADFPLALDQRSQTTLSSLASTALDQVRETRALPKRGKRSPPPPSFGSAGDWSFDVHPAAPCSTPSRPLSRVLRATVARDATAARSRA